MTTTGSVASEGWRLGCEREASGKVAKRRERATRDARRERTTRGEAATAGDARGGRRERGGRLGKVYQRRRVFGARRAEEDEGSVRGERGAGETGGGQGAR